MNLEEAVQYLKKMNKIFDKTMAGEMKQAMSYAIQAMEEKLMREDMDK